jgi:hypothetical protein
VNAVLPSFSRESFQKGFIQDWEVPRLSSILTKMNVSGACSPSGFLLPLLGDICLISDFA